MISEKEIELKSSVMFLAVSNNNRFILSLANRILNIGANTQNKEQNINFYEKGGRRTRKN